jgi:succinyl-CoA synthetase alpha subunit
MMVVLGELGGSDEYSLVEALKQGKVQKPVVAWVSGTCATLFKSEVQFGHAVSLKRIGVLFSWSSMSLTVHLVCKDLVY